MGDDGRKQGERQTERTNRKRRLKEEEGHRDRMRREVPRVNKGSGGKAGERQFDGRAGLGKREVEGCTGIELN